MKNITLSADENTIKEARLKAHTNNTTLNNLFREWLSDYIRDKNISDDLEEFFSNTYAKSGRSYSRDEYNER
jgi:hypothetical protein